MNKSGSGASPGVDAVADSLTVDVLGHVPEDDAVPHSQDLGQPVVVKSPNSGAAIAYQRLDRGVLEDDPDHSVSEGPSQDEASSPQSNDGSQESSKPDIDVSPTDPISGTEESGDAPDGDAEDHAEDSIPGDESETESTDHGGGTGGEEETPGSPNHSDADRTDGVTPTDEGTEKDSSLVSKVKQLFQSP